MTYARKMAEECAWRCVGHDPGEIERVILAVIERCAKEADVLVKSGPAGHVIDIAQNGTALMIAERIRALATSETP